MQSFKLFTLGEGGGAKEKEKDGGEGRTMNMTLAS